MGLVLRLALFFSREAHLGLLLIQLEFLSLLVLGLTLLKPGHQASLLLLGLIRLIVSEASLGLALLLFRSRHTSGEQLQLELVKLPSSVPTPKE